jgi:EmrB/QacA subfamily drug resistance transporter
VTGPQRLALAAAIMGSFVAALDSTAVNVALPAISEDLGGGLAAQQWIANGYLLTLGSLILVGGSLGDIFGERRIFSIGVAGFGAVSVLCAAAPTVEVLIAGRVLQGVFGALLTPSSLAVIVGAFSQRERGAAIGSWTAWVGIAVIIGPLAGGWLVDTASWRLIFGINVPFVVVTLLLVRRAVSARPREGAHVPVDWWGALLTIGGLAGPVLGLIRQPAVGWSSAQVWGPALLGLVLLAAFVARERTTPYPMLPLSMFRRRNFAFANLQTLFMYGGLGAAFFFLVLFLQQVAGYSALEAGLATLPSSLIMFALARRAGRMADRFGPRVFMAGGPLLSAAGLLGLLRAGADPDLVTELLLPLVVFSLGLAATVAPLTATVLADADDSNAGIASGVNNAIARVAGLLAVAALGAVVAGQFTAALDERLAGRELDGRATAAVAQARTQTLARVDPARAGEDVAQAVEESSVHAFHVGEGIAAALLAIGGILGAVGIRNPPPCSGTQLPGTGDAREGPLPEFRDLATVGAGDLGDDEPAAVDRG